MKINEILKDLLIENNLTPGQLAKQTGVQTSTIYKYIRGTLPRIENAIKIANYFSCSLNYLVGIDDEPRKTYFTKFLNLELFYPRYFSLLEENNLSHYSICKETGLSDSSLLAWKNGTVPYIDALEKIARYFGVSIDYLVGRSDKR